jgi:hypothetical protein
VHRLPLPEAVVTWLVTGFRIPFALDLLEGGND